APPVMSPPKKTKALPPPVVKKNSWCMSSIGANEGDLLRTGETHAHQRQSQVAFPAFPWTIKKRTVSRSRMTAPPVEDGAGNLYLGDHAGVFRKIAPNGTVLFSVKLGGAVWSQARLAEDEKSVFVGSDDDNIYKIATKNGTIIWKRRVFICSPRKNTDPDHVKCDQDAPPILAGGKMLMTGGRGVAALTTDGSPLWQFNVASHVRGSIASDSRGNFYFASLGYQIVSLDPKGKRRWAYRAASQCDSTPMLAAPCMVIAGCDDQGLHAVDMETGKRRWKLLGGGNFRGGGALGSDGESVYWGNTDGYLYATSLGGRVRWRYKTGGRIITPPLVDKAGNIFVVPEEKRVYLLSPAGALLYSRKIPFISDSMPFVVKSGAIMLSTEKGVLITLSTTR
ncbi:PQQ-like beta-propeller repeat protein, partial [Myxococcota bacterium]|nr:PQQ-like beta-propeller repeat protein [Myxococcota bacterium]